MVPTTTLSDQGTSARLGATRLEEEQLVQQGAHIWQQALSELQEIMTPTNYANWLQQTRCVGFEDGTLTVGVPSTFEKEYLEKKIPHLIDRTMEGLGFGHLRLRYTVVRQEPVDLQSRSTRATASRSVQLSTAPLSFAGGAAESATASSIPGGHEMSSPLNAKYVFESFIVGESNRFAYAASVAVAEQPAKRYNPLFIHGNVGLGKTHLLHAIGHHALRRKSATTVLYTTSEKFVNDMVWAIQKGHNEEFRAKYRQVDILLVDDIQFIANKEGTQEEFFHTFNTLYEAQKQVVITSDRHPKAMTTLVERLRSRFEWGLIADVQPPDLETRIAILREKAQNQSVPVPQQVIDVIARRVQSNIRELEGTLTSITAKAAVINAQVTMELATSMLDAMTGTSRRAKPTLDEVLKAVAEHYKLDRDVLLKQGRERSVALPRQVAMYLMREETEESLPRIGFFLGKRDHSTVMYGHDKIASELKNENPQIRSDVQAIRNALYDTSTR
jgi:chromosomal replication initiator protein